MNRVLYIILTLITACATTTSPSSFDTLQDPSVQRALEGRYVFIYIDSTYTPPEFMQELARHLGGVTGMQSVEFRKDRLIEREKFKATEPTILLYWSMAYLPRKEYSQSTDELKLNVELTIFPGNGNKFTKKSTCQTNEGPNENFSGHFIRTFTVCFLQLLRPWWRQ